MSSVDLALARAELLDHLVENFQHGLKWKKEKLAVGSNEIPQMCISLDLDFTNYDCEMEKSLIDCIELKEALSKSSIFSIDFLSS